MLLYEIKPSRGMTPRTVRNPCCGQHVRPERAGGRPTPKMQIYVFGRFVAVYILVVAPVCLLVCAYGAL